MTTSYLLPTKIRTDGGTQPRAQLDQPTIERYIIDMQRGDKFPALDIYHDGQDHWLADGFHRLAAWKQAMGSREDILVRIHQGSIRDAILHSSSANSNHGLPRSNEDKRRAVERLLRDDEWGQWSDREIGRCCKVDHKTVGTIRKGLTGEFPSERTYTTKHGTQATMNTAAIIESNQQRAAAPQETAEGYTPIHRLQHLLHQYLIYATGSRDRTEHHRLLLELKAQGKNGDEFEHLKDWMDNDRATYRVDDLWQAATNHTEDLRRQMQQTPTPAAPQFMAGRLEATAPNHLDGIAFIHLPAQRGVEASNSDEDPRRDELRHIRRQVETMMIAAKNIDNGGTDSQLFFALNRVCIALDAAAALLRKTAGKEVV